MDNLDWLRHHYEVEKKYRSRIEQSSKGSLERRELFREAYANITEIVKSYRPLIGAGMDSGDYLALLVEALPTGGKRVLDVGCGTGSLCLGLAGKGFETVGIDTSQEGINLSLKRAREKNLSCAFLVMDILKDGALPESEFDIVVNDNVLEHICPDEALDFILQCRKALIKGGWLISITPNRLVGPHDVSRYFLPRGVESQGMHLKEHTFRELVELTQKAGFMRIFTLPASARMCTSLGVKKAGRLWYYKSAVMERLLGLLPASLRHPRLFRLLVSDIVIAQK